MMNSSTSFTTTTATPLSSTASPVRGTCAPEFHAVQALFAAKLAAGAELGGSLSVNILGQDVVDLWGGWANADRTRAWTRETITNIYSLGKTVSALAVLVLATRGQIDLNSPVARYWPEFGAAGKGGVLVRHVLGHTAGVPGWTSRLTLAETSGYEIAVAQLAEQEPWYEPGTRAVYHGYTHGFLVGELVRRVTGKKVQEWLREEVVGPLGADYLTGRMKREDEARVAEAVVAETAAVGGVEEGGPLQVDPESWAGRVLAPMFGPKEVNDPELRHADYGAANNHSNAHGVAKILSVISLKGRTPAGEQLIDPALIERIFEVQAPTAMDPAVHLPLRWGIGMSLMNGADEGYEWMPRSERVCHWGGYGGAIGIMDVERGITIAYVPNLADQCIFMDCARTQSYVKAVYDAIA